MRSRWEEIRIRVDRPEDAVEWAEMLEVRMHGSPRVLLILLHNL